MNNMTFTRCNLEQLPLDDIQAHGGQGRIRFARVVDRPALAGACNFIDLAILPPGASVGRHTHGPDEEEFYLVLKGAGQLERNGQLFRIQAGDLIRNPPEGTHALLNDGLEDLHLFVFELEVRP